MKRIERGTYRSAYCTIVDDPDFQRLPSDARHAWWALKFSPLGNVAGIYVFYPEALGRHTGLSRRRVDAALRALREGAWIIQEGPVLWLRNALASEPGYSLAQEEKRKGVLKILAELPRLPILRRFCNYYEIEAPDDMPALPESTPEGPPGDPRGTPGRASSGPPPTPGGPPGGPPPEKEKDPDQEKDLPLKAPQGGADGFREFYRAYPVHKGPDRAERAYRSALKRGATPEALLAALRREDSERAELLRAGRFVREWPYPASWLNAGSWKDEPANGGAQPEDRHDHPGEPDCSCHQECHAKSALRRFCGGRHPFVCPRHEIAAPPAPCASPLTT